jgi:hypothetical protein
MFNCRATPSAAVDRDHSLPLLAFKLFVFTESYPDNQVEFVDVTHTAEACVGPRTVQAVSKRQKGESKLLLDRVLHSPQPHPRVICPIFNRALDVMGVLKCS